MLRGVRARVHRRRASGSSANHAFDPLLSVAVDPAALKALEALSAAADTAAPRKAGVLIKYTNAFKGWRPRLFSLDTGLLTYVGVGVNGAGGGGGGGGGGHGTTTGLAAGPCPPAADSSSHPAQLGPAVGPSAAAAAAAPAAAVATACNPQHHPAYHPSGAFPAAAAPHGHHQGARAKISSRKRKFRKKIGLTNNDKSFDASLNCIDIKDRERDVKGVINVQFAVITPDHSDPQRFAIDTGREVFHLRGESTAERDSWVEVLNASKRYFSSLVEKAALRALRNAEASSPTSAPNAMPLTANATDLWSAQTISVDSVMGLQSATAQTRTEPPSLGGSACTVPETAARGVTKSGAATGHVTVASAALSHLKELSIDGSQMEDDGVVEAAISRKALVMELRRVCQVLENGDIADVFDDETPGGGGPAAGLRDLATWALHVLQTDDVMFERRVDAAVQRARVRGVLDEDDETDWDTASDEFYDALSRSNSGRMARSANAGPPSAPSGISTTSTTETAAASAHSQALAASSSGVAAAVARDTALSSKGGVADSSKAGSVVSVTGSGPGLVSGRPPLYVADTSTRKSVSWTGYIPRTALPRLANPAPKLNVWGILKDSVGRDLSKISIPVGLNEPISFLQRLAEDIEYCELLDQAAAEPDPHRRMMLVATMIVSHYSSTQGRTGKPFNPLLGETYSLIAPTKGQGIRFLAEQVSHHPPMSACYAEGANASWKYYNAIEVKNKFWGKSLEVFPTGWNHIEIPGYGDHYEYEQVTACVHNIVIGKMWLDNYGDMVIVNRATQDRCIVKFQKSGWFSDSKTFGNVSGTVYDAEQKIRARFSGRWTDAIYEDCRDKSRKLIWQAAERPPLEDSNNYNMTRWAIGLNQPLPPEDQHRVASSDSRFRPDQRALEDGLYDLASLYKNAIEEGQRARRQKRAEAGEAWRPLWFDLAVDPTTGREDYVFNGKYFKAQAEGNWEGVPDLYSCATLPPAEFANGSSSSSQS